MAISVVLIENSSVAYAENGCKTSHTWDVSHPSQFLPYSVNLYPDNGVVCVAWCGVVGCHVWYGVVLCPVFENKLIRII